MLQGLLDLEESRQELAHTETLIRQVQDAAVVCPERQRERLLALTWWKLRQAEQVRELERA